MGCSFIKKTNRQHWRKKHTFGIKQDEKREKNQTHVSIFLQVFAYVKKIGFARESQPLPD